MRKLLLFLLLATAAWPQAIPYSYYVPAYAYGSGGPATGGRVYTGNSTVGLATITLYSSTVALSNGHTIVPYATNAPIVIGTGATQETVTPTAISGCYSGANIGICTITANFAFLHIQGEFIASGTYGLQEAINDATTSGGGTLIIDNTWGGSTGMITGAAGNTHVVIQDNRQGQTLYTWNGSNYTASGGTGVSPAFQITTQTFGASETFNNSGAQNQMFVLTLTGNVTSSSMQSNTAGQMAEFVLCQDATGGRTFAWPANFSNPPSINTTANFCTTAQFVYDTNTLKWQNTSTVTGNVTTSGSPASTQGAFFSGFNQLTSSANWTYSAASGFSVIQGANAADLFYGKRATDTLPTGNFLHFQDNAAATDLFTVDVTGLATAQKIASLGTVSAATAYLLNGNAGTAGCYLGSDGVTGYAGRCIQSSDLSTALATPPSIGLTTPAASGFTSVKLTNSGHSVNYSVNAAGHATLDATLEVPSTINLNGNWTAGTIAAAGDGICASGNNVASDCSHLSTASFIGIAPATTGTIYPQTSGYVTVNFDGTYSPSVGWFVCQSTTSDGKFVPESSPCPSGQPQIGVIAQAGTSETSGQIWLNIGAGSSGGGNVTASSTLVNNAVVIGQSGESLATIPADTTITHALFTTAGAPGFRAIANSDLPGTGATTVNGDTCTLGSTCQVTGGVNNQTASYTLTATDNGELVVMNCAAACNVTLPASPSAGFYARVMTIGASVAAVVLNGHNVNGGTGVPVLVSWMPEQFYWDGTEWKASAPIKAGTNISLTPSATGVSIAASGGTGTVTSFSAGNLSPIFTTSVATATTTPALTFGLSNQSANTVLSGPSSGAAAAPTFRALVPADVPFQSTYIVLNCTQTTIQAGDTLTAAGGFATACKIPANTLAVGSVIHLRDSGITVTGTNTSPFQFGVRLCTVSAACANTVNSLGTDGALTQNANLTQPPWTLWGDFPVTAIGSGTSASLEDEFYTIKTSGGTTGVALSRGGGGPATFDSTVDEYLVVFENATISAAASAVQRALVVWITK